MNNDFDLEQQNIDRRRKYAELLRANNKQPEGQMVSGHYVAPPMLANLNVIGNQLLGQYGGMQADKQAADLNKRKNTALVEGLKQYQNTAQGTPGIAPATPNDDEGNVMPGVDAVAADPLAAAQGLIASGHPMLQELGIKQLVAGLAPKQAEGVNINGQLVNKFTGERMGSTIPKQEEAYTLTPGGVRFGPDGKQLAAVGDFNKPFNPDGTPNVGFQSYDIGKARAGAPSIVNKVDVKSGESLAKEVGPIMKEASDAATAASNQVMAAQRINKAIDSNKVFTGPTANVRLQAAQVGDMLGITGKDTQEKIANTRQAIQGLAQLTLNGRKQMRGQGAITENESKLAERAISGDISLTPTELKILSSAAERAGQFEYNNYARKMQALESNPGTSGLAPYYQAQPLPEMTAPTLNAAPSPSGFKIIGVK